MTILLASSFIIAGAYAINYKQENKKTTPEQTVSQFFFDWINYEGNPLLDRYYTTSPQVSESYSKKVDEIIESFDKSAYDPILCAQDFPEEIKIINTAIEQNKALITIEKVYSGGSLLSEVYLEHQNGKWLITDIICEEGENKGENLNSNVSPAIQNQVSSYIRENINELSPKEAVLGGTFYVTSINFSGPCTSIVDYEDGHITLTAKVEFNIPSADKIEIVSFQLLSEETTNFNKTGNITKSGADWNLVYEEPGSPALTKILEFTDSSKCLDQYENKACFPNYWEIGDRVKVVGTLDSDKIIISEFSVISESSQTINSGVRADKLPVTNFEECLAVGYEKMEPDCVGCKNYCETADGTRFEEETKDNPDSICEDLCGDGICQEMVCLGQGCPCAESITSCPQDCSK